MAECWRNQVLLAAARFLGRVGAAETGSWATNQKEKNMRYKIIMSGLLALGLSALTTHAWVVSGVVLCPSGRPDINATVSIPALGLSTLTDSSGGYDISLPDAAFKVK